MAGVQLVDKRRDSLRLRDTIAGARFAFLQAVRARIAGADVPGWRRMHRNRGSHPQVAVIRSTDILRIVGTISESGGDECSNASADILGQRWPEGRKACWVEIVGNCTGFCTNRISGST
jgi:hypothetical protein